VVSKIGYGTTKFAGNLKIILYSTSSGKGTDTHHPHGSFAEKKCKICKNTHIHIKQLVSQLDLACKNRS
jgi:hypothetical protein